MCWKVRRQVLWPEYFCFLLIWHKKQKNWKRGRRKLCIFPIMMWNSKNNKTVWKLRLEQTCEIQSCETFSDTSWHIYLHQCWCSWCNTHMRATQHMLCADNRITCVTMPTAHTRSMKFWFSSNFGKQTADTKICLARNKSTKFLTSIVLLVLT